MAGVAREAGGPPAERPAFGWQTTGVQGPLALGEVVGRSGVPPALTAFPRFAFALIHPTRKRSNLF